MRLLRNTRCARCGHKKSVHSMLVAGLDGEDVRVPCGFMHLQPAFGGLMRLRACACPRYMAPARFWLRAANALLGWTSRRTRVLALIFVLYLGMTAAGVAILGWSW